MPEGAAVRAQGGYANNCLVRSISKILSGDRLAFGAGSAIRERFAYSRGGLVAKYGRDPVAELELQVRRRFSVCDLGFGPSDWANL